LSGNNRFMVRKLRFFLKKIRNEIKFPNLEALKQQIAADRAVAKHFLRKNTMGDYRETLNLPQTAFPMRANLAQREPEILERWRQMGLYHKLRQHFAGAPRYILHDGPPYANGKLHIGHAVNKILKDIIVKSQTLKGFDAPFVPGWDCHGLPIELQVEKTLGNEVSDAVFRQACRDYARSQIALQKEDFMRMGVIGDWDNPYLTMDPAFEANILRQIGRLLEKACSIEALSQYIGASTANRRSQKQKLNTKSAFLQPLMCFFL